MFFKGGDGRGVFSAPLADKPPSGHNTSHDPIPLRFRYGRSGAFGGTYQKAGRRVPVDRRNLRPGKRAGGLRDAAAAETARADQLVLAAVGLSDLLEDFCAYAGRSGGGELQRQD
ncbi:MAG: hypothetical protein LBK74_02635 [Treponema sp.]|nr:hypothetical protein [Treponema sp.]